MWDLNVFYIRPNPDVLDFLIKSPDMLINKLGNGNVVRKRAVNKILSCVVVNGVVCSNCESVMIFLKNINDFISACYTPDII